MALYLVVRHPQNPRQTFENRWQDNELLTSIQTTLEIGNRCREAMAQNQWVYIHRCGYNGYEPMICCAVHVAAVEEIGSWIIVTQGIHDRFVAALAQQTAALRVGDALDLQTKIGPVASEA